MVNRQSFLYGIYFSLLLLAVTSCHSQKTIKTERGDIAFVGVHILPMTSDTILPNQTVIIRNGKILHIAPTSESMITGDANVVNSTGKFLMPGISEMHAHIPTPDAEGNDERVKETLFLYLSNGITTIRGMLGQPYHLELKKLVDADSLLSPRVYTSSPSMNGNSVQTIEEAITKVKQYADDGYDFLKIHPGIQLEVFDALVKTAKEKGIPFSGHVPVAVGIERAIDFGYASIDHLDGYLDGLVPKRDDFDPDAGGLFGFDFTDQAKPTLIKDLIKKTKEADIWIVPTQSLLVRWLSPKSGAEMANEPEMKYVTPGTRFSWRQSKEQILGQENYNKNKANTFINLRNQLLKEMEIQDVNLLLGSDAPQIFNVPGFSIQHEMQALSAAGLSNYTILKSGTINPALFFKEPDTYGSIQVGAVADLILLNNNPLDDIKNMQQPLGVMVRGEWLEKEYLEAQLEEIAQKYDE